MIDPSINRERRALSVLEDALALPQDDREHWLSQTLPDDPSLAERVQSLLLSASMAKMRISAGGAINLYVATMARRSR